MWQNYKFSWKSCNMYSCPITVQISSCFLHLLDRVHIFVATNVQLSPLDDCTFFTFHPRVFLLVLWVVWVDESVALQSRRHKFHHSEIKTNKIVYLLSFQKGCRIRKVFFFSVCCPSVMSLKPLFEWSQLQLSCKFTTVGI